MFVEAGNLVSEPDLQYSNKGNAWVRFTIAVNRHKEDDGHFFDCKAFNEQAENIAESFNKGDRLLVSGRVDHERWETKDGDKRSRHVVIAREVGRSVRWDVLPRPGDPDFAPSGDDDDDDEVPF